MTTVTLAERFWSKVEKTSGCWEWLASRYSNGYGQFDHRGAHRVAYELATGPIPEGLVLDHLCRNKGCVNPAHLEPVTTAENVRRGEAPKVSGANRRRLMAEREQCVNGHALSEDNTYIWPATGWRQCRTCKRAENRRRRARREPSA